MCCCVVICFAIWGAHCVRLCSRIISLRMSQFSSYSSLQNKVVVEVHNNYKTSIFPRYTSPYILPLIQRSTYLSTILQGISRRNSYLKGNGCVIGSNPTTARLLIDALRAISLAANTLLRLVLHGGNLFVTFERRGFRIGEVIYGKEPHGIVMMRRRRQLSESW